MLRHSCFVIILHPAVTNISQVKGRNRAVIFDFLLYESERKRFYEGRTASGAAISATKKTLAQLGASSFVEQKKKFPRKSARLGTKRKRRRAWR